MIGQRSSVCGTVVLVVAMSTAGAELSAQRMDTDSLRRATRASIEQYQGRLAEAVRVFGNREQPVQQRLAAVNGIASFDDPAHVAVAVRIAFDAAEPEAVRVRGIQLGGHRALHDGDLLGRLLGLAADPAQGAALRRESVRQLPAALFATHAGHGPSPELLRTLRQLSRDNDAEIRRPVLGMLAAWRDAETLRLLEQGLRTPTQGLLPPHQAALLLGLDHPAEHYPIFRQLLRQPPDAETRLVAIRMLAEDEASRQELIRILQGRNESADARLAAMGALRAGDGPRFAAHVLPIVRDESAPTALRVRALTTVEYQRVSRDAGVRQRRLDDFDREVQRLAQQSGDPEVRRIAGRYVQRTRSPH